MAESDNARGHVSAALPRESPLAEAIVLLITASSVGLFTGYLAGITNIDAGVVTAILSTILTGATAALAFLWIRSGTHQNILTMACLAVIFFCAALYAGIQYGLGLIDLNNQKRIDDYTTLIDHRYGNYSEIHAGLLEQHARRLVECALAEANVNAVRGKLNLKPLPAADFCPLSPPSVSDALAIMDAKQP